MDMAGRIMGLDHGSKTVGVALSDPLRITAEPFETIVRRSENKLRQTLSRLEQIIQEYDVREIVLGLPLNMDGTQGERALKTLEFRDMLEKRTGIKVKMLDERLTTVAADEMLEEMEVPKAKRKDYIDQVAASIILREYLEKTEVRKD